MAIIAGSIALTSKTFDTVVLSASAATSTTNPVTIQWFRSTVNAFTPASQFLVLGSTLTLTDEALTPGATYYYIIRYTDTITSASVDSVVMSVTLWAAPSVISDPVAIQFCNERIRPFADLLRSLFYTSGSILTIYGARTELYPIIPDQMYDIVQDGLNRPISGHDIQNIIAWANQVIALGSGYTDMLNSIEKVSINGRAIF